MDITVTERRNKVRNYKDKGNRPDREECYQILRDFDTPPHVVRHCEAVCDVAMKVGKELNKYGFDFDLDLVQAAGLVHDVARVEDKHWDVGADLMLSKGYQDVADIVRVHMYYPAFSDIDDATETDLVCLGDRTVLEDQYVGLTDRIEYIIGKIRGQKGTADYQAHVDRLRGKMMDSQRFIDGVERVTGKTLDEIVNEG